MSCRTGLETASGTDGITYIIGHARSQAPVTVGIVDPDTGEQIFYPTDERQKAISAKYDAADVPATTGETVPDEAPSTDTANESSGDSGEFREVRIGPVAALPTGPAGSSAVGIAHPVADSSWRWSGRPTRANPTTSPSTIFAAITTAMAHRRQ